MSYLLHLSVSNSITDGKSLRITKLSEDNVIPIELFHEFDCDIPFSETTLLDGHVLTLLLYIMSRGKPLRVHGNLSHGGMRNMEELQLIWSRWKPENYRKIEIIPDSVVDGRRIGPNKAISAFSGGVDATFTAIRHTKLLPESTRYPLTDVMMVHGFDVGLSNNIFFEQLKIRVKPLLNELGLSLRTIRTNSKELGLQHFSDSFALELAGCMHMHSEEFQYGLIGSSEPYDALVLPWGSSPVTDHLISGDRFSIIHDGAGFSRTDKVAAVARYPTACKTVKVCWEEGTNQSENCGRCQKCVRTKLNFLSVGSPIPESLPGGLNLDDIRDMNINHRLEISELAGIIKYAKAHSIIGEWITVLERRISRGLTTYERSLPRKVIMDTLKAIGLKGPLKKIWRKIFQ